MKRWVYDVEVFPNFFDVIFKNIETKETKTFVIFNNRDDRYELDSFLNDDMLLIGFNNILYDGAILQYIIQNLDSKNLLNELFSFSSLVINSERYSYNADIIKYQRPESVKYKQLDLMRINAYDKLGVSLKQCAINLKWHTIQDLPYDYDHVVANWDEANFIIKYNMNDVEISEALYWEIYPQIEMREKLSKTYNADLTSASDSKMANIILEHFYSSELGVDIQEIRSKRTKRESFLLKDCISPLVQFETNFLKRTLREVSDTVVRKERNWKYSKSIQFAGVKYDMGVGGLHSDDFPAKFISDEEYTIIDSDVASFYPSMMINNKIVPSHLNRDGFIKILNTMTRERLESKKTDKVKADGLKISINSIFGKLGSETFWLEDPKAMLSVTVSGQLYLLMLIESFILNGIEVISANTDGVVCRVKNSLLDKHAEVCKRWEEKTNFVLEHTPYKLYVRQDVNNYITEKIDGEVKAKGRFLKKIDLKKGYKYPVVPIAMYDYLLKNIPLEETIRNHGDILDFCMSQKVGKQFQTEFFTADIPSLSDEEKKQYLTEKSWFESAKNTWRNEKLEGEMSGQTLEAAFENEWKKNNSEKLQKNNRFYISLTGGELYKRHKEKGSITGLAVGKKARILNNYDDSLPIESYNVDYDFYIEEAKKFCENIQLYENSMKPFEDEEAGIVIDYSTQEMKEELLLKLNGMKGLSDKTMGALIKIAQEFTSSDFLELLVFAEENSLISSKYLDLIRVNYFVNFGKNKKLECMFKEFRDGKFKYKRKLSDKSKESRLKSLKEIWDNLDDCSYSFKEQVEMELSILGRLSSTYNISGGVIFVEKLSTKFAPKVEGRILKTGKKVEIRIYKNLFANNPFNVGDVLLCTSVEKKKPTKYIDGRYVDQPGDLIKWVTRYEVITNKIDSYIKQ